MFSSSCCFTSSLLFYSHYLCIVRSIFAGISHFQFVLHFFYYSFIFLTFLFAFHCLACASPFSLLTILLTNHFFLFITFCVCASPIFLFITLLFYSSPFCLPITCLVSVLTLSQSSIVKSASLLFYVAWTKTKYYDKQWRWTNNLARCHYNAH